LVEWVDLWEMPRRAKTLSQILHDNSF